MADHLATTPSQVAHPWRATLRTFFEVFIPAVTLVLAVGPEVLRILAEDLGADLPPGVTAWLLGAALFLASVSAALARIAAIPRVNALLGKVRLDAGKPAITGSQVPDVNPPATITDTTEK